MSFADHPYRVGVFQSLPEAGRAVRGLLASGFQKDEISVICSDRARIASFREFHRPSPAGTQMPGAGAVGGLAGASVGGVVLAATSILTGGGALLLAAGSLLVGGLAVTGTIVGMMTARGFEKEIADYYDQALERGDILVAAEAREEGHEHRLARAEAVFAEAGAQPIPLTEA